MSVETVKEYLKQYGHENDVLEFDQSSATVELAAVAVGVIPARIAKTLSFKRDDGAILIVTAGDARIDNGKFKKEFATKAKMLTPDEVISFTGHTVGGVCPFAIESDAVETVLDSSLRRFDLVYPAAGSASSAVRLTCEELFKCSRATRWVDVCKDWAE